MTSPPATQTLADFITPRLDEDEAAARAAIDYPDDGTWNADTSIPADAYVDAIDEQGIGQPIASGLKRSHAAHIARHDPARVLAQVAAMRAVVEIHETYRGPRILKVDSTDVDFGCVVCHCIDPIREDGIIEALGYCETVTALAAIWDSDPGWRDEWAM